jgi:hypothetical protein
MAADKEHAPAHERMRTHTLALRSCSTPTPAWAMRSRCVAGGHQALDTPAMALRGAPSIAGGHSRLGRPALAASRSIDPPAVDDMHARLSVTNALAPPRPPTSGRPSSSVLAAHLHPRAGCVRGAAMCISGPSSLSSLAPANALPPANRHVMADVEQLSARAAGLSGRRRQPMTLAVVCPCRSSQNQTTRHPPSRRAWARSQRGTVGPPASVSSTQKPSTRSTAAVHTKNRIEMRVAATHCRPSVALAATVKSAHPLHVSVRPMAPTSTLNRQVHSAARPCWLRRPSHACCRCQEACAAGPGPGI